MRREVGLEPLALRRRRAAAAGAAAVRVERDDVPASDVERVPALAAGSRSAAEVVPVTRRASVGRVAAGATRGEVLMVAHGGTGDRFHAAPARVVRLLEGAEPGAVVLIVAEREHRAVAPADEK